MILFLRQENPHKPVDGFGFAQRMISKFEVFVSQPLDDHSRFIVKAPADGYYHPIYWVGNAYNLYVVAYIPEPEVHDPNRYLNK